MAGGDESDASFSTALGWMVGAGALLIPGLEAMHAAGPILGMLGGVGAGVTWADSLARSLAQACRNTRPSATRVAYVRVAFFCLYTAATQNGRRRRAGS